MAEPRRWPRVLPDTLAWGVFTLLFAAVIVMAGGTLLFLFINYKDVGVRAAASQAADQIIVIKRMIERDHPEDRMRLVRRLNSPTMRMLITTMPMVTESDDRLSSRVVLNRLRSEFPPETDIRVDSRIDVAGPSDANIELPPTGSSEQIEIPTPRGPGPGFHPPRMGDTPPRETETAEQRELRRLTRLRNSNPQFYDTQGSFRVSIKFAENTWFNARVVLNLGEAKSRLRPILFLSLMSLIVAVAALWGIYRALRPFAAFTAAAERLGVDVNAPPLSDSGPREVRRAARAFNTMQGRLKRFVQDRTQMLAAISHDLRTPITRLRLRAEFIDGDEQRDKMLKDLDEMESMIAATLTFARDDAANEPVTTVDIAGLLSAIAEDNRAAGNDVIYTGPESYDAVVRPTALKRAINNLVNNAVKYGLRGRITLVPGERINEILIDDDGPGIPEADRERVFAPFVRLEASRSRETGGAGLGLTIARTIVRGLGGDVELLSLPEGGLRVRLTLPDDNA